MHSLIKASNQSAFQTFTRACTGHIGQLVNYKSLADMAGISIPTAKEWLSILERSYIVFTLPPYFRNFNKRLVKTPKLYFYDTGLACYLLGMRDVGNVETYYQKDSLFENLILAELVKQSYHRGERPAFYFWRDNHRVEVDLLWESGMKVNVMEVKSSKTVHSRFLKPLHQFKQYAGDQFGRAYLVYGGSEDMLREGIQILSWKKINNFTL